MKRFDSLRSQPWIHMARVADLPAPARVALNALLVGLWLWLYRPVFSYLAIIFTREDFRTNQIVLLLVAGLLVTRRRGARASLAIDAPPQRSAPALALLVASSVLFVLAERLLDIHTLSAALFGLAAYGLVGLWLSPPAWRQGLPVALLIVGVLPFGDHLQTFVGYPLRILTASIVRDGLAAAGVSAVGVDTILVLENNVSQIDLPCSGVKSLWTGALFLLAATWIRRRPIGLRWFGVALVFGALLFLTNLARIGTLVVVGQVIGSRLAAEMLHVPLGVLGFVAACGAGLLLLETVPPLGEPAIPAERISARPPWLAPALASVLIALGLAYTPPPAAALTLPAQVWEWPAEMHARALPLTPEELDWFRRDSALAADRVRFTWHGLSGSLILVTSTTWRAHHRPERCFEVYGLAVDDSITLLAAPDFPVRSVAVSSRAGAETWSAAYWFQTGGRVTDDYGARLADDLSLQHRPWVLVSILWEGPQDPHAAEIVAFYRAVRATVAESLARSE